MIFFPFNFLKKIYPVKHLMYDLVTIAVHVSFNKNEYPWDGEEIIEQSDFIMLLDPAVLLLVQWIMVYIHILSFQLDFNPIRRSSLDVRFVLWLTRVFLFI